jgi:hypothetical protein
MKIIDQERNLQEIFELEQNILSLYGRSKNIKKPKILLGTYRNRSRLFDVMSEIYSLNQKDKNYIYTMPLE